ncbi:MAG: hypothetical protein EXS13_15185, partial [Planctomycetes bacterium]|nr:hypothetical protein [Planctomycetota bacterium]
MRPPADKAARGAKAMAKARRETGSEAERLAALLGAVRHTSALIDAPAPVRLRALPESSIAAKANAIQLIASGLRLSEVARRLELGRRTLYHWLAEDVVFNAALTDELARRRQSIREAAAATWLAALDVLRDVFESGSTPERLQAAALALKLARPLARRKDRDDERRGRE